jgi:SAM-dependent methyltransferase
MEICFLNYPLTSEQERFLERDNHPDPEFGSYRVDRGMDEILSESVLPFNYFEYLNKLAANKGDRVEVLEGGCGIGNALVDLKRGLKSFGLDITMRDWSIMDPDVQKLIESLVAKPLKGLGNKIHTSGLTLSPQHVEVALGVEDVYRLDRIIVGPLDVYSFTTKDRYDFIFDRFGPAMYFREEAIRAYGRLLKPGAQALLRLSVDLGSDEMHFVDYAERMRLKVVDHRVPTLGNQSIMDLWVQKP